MNRIVYRSMAIVFALQITVGAYGWGITGHRAVGYIASKHLTKKAQKQIFEILDGRSLAYVGSWMDEIKSDPKYDHTQPWHYCTIPDGMTYESAGTPAEGDVIVVIERLLKELESKNFTDGDEATTLKLLIHLIADVHQPLHVGNGKDRGGNGVQVSWFWRKTNLHKVWDVDMIDHKRWSATEMALEFDIAPPAMIEKWQHSDVRQWAIESKDLRDQIYTMPENHKLGWDYIYRNWNVVELRILQAGIRLAGVLNGIYG